MKLRRSPLEIESLEERLTPAFSAYFNSFSGLWTLSQTSSAGAVTVSVTALNTLELTEGASTVTLGSAGTGLTLNMLSGTGDDVTFNMDSPLSGDVNLFLNAGDRTATLGGTFSDIGGNVRINASTGNQLVNLANDSAMFVGGSFFMDLGLGDDTVSGINDMFVGSDMTLRGSNFYDHVGMLSVGRNFAMYNNTENASGGYAAFFPNGMTSVGGNFTYYGGNLDDAIFLGDGANIGGNLYVNTGNNFAAPPDDFVDEVRLDGAGPGVVIGGNVTVVAGNNPFATNRFITDDFTVIGGSVNINMARSGFGGGISTGVILRGIIGGPSVTVYTGSFLDNVTYALTSGNPRVTAILGAGNDTFQINNTPDNGIIPPNPTASYMYIDFGLGADSFLNTGGVNIYWPLVLRNLP